MTPEEVLELLNKVSGSSKERPMGYTHMYHELIVQEVKDSVPNHVFENGAGI